MFDFEKLDAYRIAKEIHFDVTNLLKQYSDIDAISRNQLKRASLSTVLNIAEGSGKFSKADKQKFYVIARGSVYECVSILEILSMQVLITSESFRDFYLRYERLSKMLTGLIHNTQNKLLATGRQSSRAGAGSW